jgi:outer membrane protein assembly factor BamB
MQGSFDYYGQPYFPILGGQIAYGKLYSAAYAGIVYCYDMKTGNLLWTYGNGGEGNSTNAGFYVAYGNYPTFVAAVGNDVVYTITTEHTVSTPLYKGAMTRAINATDGSEIWKLSAYTGSFSVIGYGIADGFATFFNGYDNQIYVVGRGPSELTVEAPKTGIDLGKSLIISGTVTDISSGSTQDEQAARFPHGLPVASDASMTDWMGYLYQQKPMPTDFTGVEVTINVVDSNGNFRSIGTATTDASGMYSLHWTPDIEGKYTVIASFAGTKGYWPSYSETSFAVDPAPATPTPTTAPFTDVATNANLMTFMAIGVVAIIIAIAIVGLLILRKRP